MKVFISHSSHDRWIARQIASLIEAVDCRTFLDEKDMRTGDSIDESIQGHLKDTDDLLVLISPYSIKSHWVFIEIGSAKALGKRIVPILLHVEANEIPAAISRHLARDINELDRYLTELKARKAGGAAGATPSPGQPTPPKRKPPVMTRDGYRVGQRVKIIDVNLLTEDDKHKSPKWTQGMNMYSEAETEVVSIEWEGHDDNEIIVKLAIDGGRHGWATRWLRRAG